MDHQDIYNMICQTVEDGNMVLDMDSGKLRRYEQVETTNSDLGESGSLHWTTKNILTPRLSAATSSGMGERQRSSGTLRI